ncbi:alcohol dehydrogenase catalytic domain-containing protein [Frateuria defendens]|uniref:alcohol dehydrogenase catalytic domain-containing protein n=1 Tax=Frateuria defendens TaxID=2219559 RepID=UPI00069FE860|nr:alcohol dehydrogenase catalytic domain-containing protein [Frateuria defendens]
MQSHDPILPAVAYRAWAWHRAGEAGELTLESRPLREPGPGEVLVANRLVALNPVDWKTIEWAHPSWRPVQVPGVDGMGRIVARGAGVQLPLGMRVAYHQSLARDGSFAEYTCLAADAVLPVPAGVSDEVAAGVPCLGFDRRRTRARQTPAQPVGSDVHTAKRTRPTP